jgi:hypothetical protein
MENLEIRNWKRESSTKTVATVAVDYDRVVAGRVASTVKKFKGRVKGKEKWEPSY